MPHSSAETKAPGRILQLDGVRAVAVTSVFLHHSLHLKLAWMGVDLFFILSGFLITGILIKQRTKPLGEFFSHFYSRRARRILPPYLILLVVTVLLFGVSWLKYGYMYIALMNFIHPLKMPGPPNLGILWSLAVEEQFYLVWPFAVYFLSESVLTGTAIGLLILAPVLRGLCTPLFPTIWAIYSLTPFRVDLLAMGALIAIVWKNHRGVIYRFGHYALILPAISVLTLIWLFHRYNISTYANTRASNVLIYEMSLIASTGVILWALSGKFVGILKLKPLVYLGRISYTAYLIHATFLALLLQHFVGYKLALLAGAGTLLYSAISWRWVEQPLLGTKPAEASVVTAPAQS